ncbi:MAG: hypothetical protein KBA14_02210 [Saprospiraceae bacterium]|nr:hypothetical protein [Saprospiraceae bacterium]
MKVYLNVIITICILFLGFTDVKAQMASQPRAGGVGSWRLLGHTQAKFSADHDAIFIAGPYDYFRRLKFKVTDAPINMMRMIVRYDDGGAPENIDLRFNIPQGGESRVIDLRGGRRKLKSVEFWYDTKGILNGRADVTLFGLK